jgi:hypothetical protein
MSLRRRRSRTADDRGAALVEFALVAPFLFLLAFGLLEIGLAWRDSQLVTQAARTGARGAAQLGINDQSDAFVVESVEATLGHLSGDLNRIVIYDASAPDGSMPPACEGAGPPGVAGQCSVYDQASYGTYANFANGAWPPASRDNTAPDTSYVGVRVEINRPYITGLFPNAIQIADTTVMSIEPAE